MLINFNDIVKKYGVPKGIIHIGAHLMEERDVYLQNEIENIVWIEANPEVFSNIKHVNNNSNEYAFNYAITDVDFENVELKVTNNGQSSSILDLYLHKKYHPNIYVINTISVLTITMNTLLMNKNLNIDNYDFINLDIQGAELLALKGFGNLLNKVKYIYTEVNINDIYKNCALLDQIDDYLKFFNFSRVEIKMTEYEWGDALYIKNKI